MTCHDLRTFIGELRAEGGLADVPALVDPELESTAPCLRALREQGPALMMRATAPAGARMLGNLFGHRARIEAALAGPPLSSLRGFGT